MPCQVRSAVSAWSWLTAFAPFVRRSEKAVMSNCVRVAVDAAAQLEDALDRHAAVSAAVAVEERAGDAADEVGVEPLVAGRDRRVDREDAVAPDARPRRRRAPRRRRRARAARSPSRNAEWPSLRCQTAGSMPSARMARTPPTPRTSSWWSRISRPRTYRMWVIGRSAASFSGRSVSSSRTGTRPTWASQTATARSRPGSSTVTVERLAVRRPGPG